MIKCNLIYETGPTTQAFSKESKTYRGGRIEFNISSVCWAFCCSIGGSLLPPLGGGFGTGPPFVGACCVVLSALA